MQIERKYRDMIEVNMTIVNKLDTIIIFLRKCCICKECFISNKARELISEVEIIKNYIVNGADT